VRMHAHATKGENIQVGSLNKKNMYHMIVNINVVTIKECIIVDVRKKCATLTGSIAFDSDSSNKKLM